MNFHHLFHPIGYKSLVRADFLESGSVILSGIEKRNPVFYQRKGFLKNFGVDNKCYVTPCLPFFIQEGLLSLHVFAENENGPQGQSSNHDVMRKSSKIHKELNELSFEELEREVFC